MMRMKRLVLSLLLIWAGTAMAQTPAGRNIQITLKPLKNCKVYLGSYYGKTRVLADSCMLNANSQGVFKGKTKLTGGIYFVVSPDYVIQFELLMDRTQQFSIMADTAQKDKAIIIGSPDNDLFRKYSQFSTNKGMQLQALEQQLQQSRTATDSSKLQSLITAVSNELQVYRKNIMQQQPKSMLSMLFKVMQTPTAPPIPIVNGKPDSIYPYRFVKEHFWDDVVFNDDRLLRTPFFEPKLDDYLKYYVSPDPDSVIQEVQYLLLSARGTKELYPYLLTKFTNKYMNPEYMGQDKVFVYLFEQHYLKGDTTYLNAASRKTIFERGYSMIANQLGQPAPVLDLTDSTGKPHALYDIKAPFTFVSFWDPHCGHCKETIPRVDSIFRARWKGLGVAQYAVNVDEKIIDDWKKFIQENKLEGWTHVYQTKAARQLEEKAGLPNFRQLYDVKVTPTFYLLDKDKRIIAKQLTIEQFDELITERLKKK